jgi:4-amino-4-deoxy-L-arabinose transferase-like glycosyltransferase
MSLTHNRYEVLKSNKYPILITIGFFLVTTYVSFFHHDFWTIFDQDGLIYLSGGQQIIAGVGENVSFLNAGPAGPVLFALLESVLKDGLFATKIVSILSGTGIVFFSYMVFKNIFSSKIALVGQLFIAFNPWIGILSISSVNDLFPIFLSIFSLYFITKKDIKLTDVIFSGAILGIGLMFRFQPAIFLLAIIIFLILLRKKPKFKISAVALLIVFFVLCCSPMLFYNYTVQEKLIDSNSNYYIAAHSKYYTQEWKDLLFDNMDKNSNAIFSNPDLFIKNYFYNMFYGQPSNLFGFENKVSASLIPVIPILGMIPVLGGLIYSLKIPASKKTFMTVMATAAITTAFVFLLGNFQDHFFAIIIIPLIVLGFQNIHKVDKKLLLLIIMAVIFSVIMAHLPLRSYKHFLYLWIFLAPLCSIFFVSVIPRLFLKIQNSKLSSTKILENQKSSKIIISVIISLILLANLSYSYVTLEVITTGNSVDTILENFKSPFSEKINPNKHDLDNIVTILKNQPDIENSYVMASYIYFADIVGAKWMGVQFQEGPDGDSIDNYITKKNWKSWQIYFSNISSEPMDRHNLNHPIPDYLIYNPKSFHLESLKVLADPTNSEIPQNFELLYKSPYTGITAYKINPHGQQ